MKRTWLIREACLSLMSHRVATGLIMFVSAITVLVPMLTVGRALALERGLAAAVETAPNRTVHLTLRDSAAFPRGAVEVVSDNALVEAAYGLGAPVDMWNAAFDGATGGRGEAAVAVYPFVGDLADLGALTGGRTPLDGEIVLTPGAMDVLGMKLPFGGLRATSTHLRVRAAPMLEGSVVGQIRLTGGAFITGDLGLRPTDGDTEVRRVVVRVGQFGDLARLTAVLPAVAGVDAGALRIESLSGAVSTVEQVTSGVREFNRSLIAASVLIGAVVLTMIVLGIVQGRRKDFGRLRVLGASRLTLAGLVVSEVLVSSIIGASSGVAIGAVVVWAATGELPVPTFTVSLGIHSVLVCALAAVVPAALAGWRDPIAALRVP